jgi:hypothetical protein
MEFGDFGLCRGINVSEKNNRSSSKNNNNKNNNNNRMVSGSLAGRPRKEISIHERSKHKVVQI